MREFREHKGIAAPLMVTSIDTDAIIPSREIKRVSKEGLGQALFAGWRYLDRGKPEERPNPDFVLNRPEFENASILLTGDNMGCGSSREYAVWALADFGIRSIIAPGFGSIFYTNCVRNGVLPVVLDGPYVANLAAQVERGNPEIKISLLECMVTAPNGDTHPFRIEASHREMLLCGLDAIEQTLQSQALIDYFKQRDRKRRAWAYLDQS